jgi:hypothetical protein
MRVVKSKLPRDRYLQHAVLRVCDVLAFVRKTLHAVDVEA